MMIVMIINCLYIWYNDIIEPLAALDYETDELIQNTIWKCFENKTLIIIASQLSHIMKADRIMVLDSG